MISFRQILQQVLTEKMSFRDLYRSSDPGRVSRSHGVRSKSLEVTSMDGNEAWTFSYKSSPSTTGTRWHGYVRFLKEDVSNKDRADQLDCMVDCDCPDYRFRWAYNNAAQGAGTTGGQSWNGNNGQPPRPREQGGVGDLGVGMCKHLLSLGEFLKTKIEPEAPQPDDQPQQVPQPKQQVQPPKKVQPSQPSRPSVPTRPTINAPDPDDTYSDSRGELQEGMGHLAENLSRLVQSTPQFQVPYPDEEHSELNEDYHIHHNEYRLYEGNNKIMVLFDDNSRLSFEIHYREKRGIDKEDWRHKAMTTWKSLASKLHGNVELSDAYNPIQKSWKECFEEALKDPKLKEFIRDNHHQRVFDP